MVQSVIPAEPSPRLQQPIRGQRSEVGRRITAIHHFLSNKYESREKGGQRAAESRVGSKVALPSKTELAAFSSGGQVHFGIRA